METGVAKTARSEAVTAWLMLAPYVLLVALFVAVPLLAIILKSFSASDSVTLDLLTSPSRVLSELSSLRNYVAIFDSAYGRRMVVNTIVIAAIVATLLLLVGINVGYFVTRRRDWAPAINTIVMFPALAPAITICLGIVWVLGPSGPFNYLLFDHFDLIDEPLRLQGSIVAVIVGDMALFCTLAVRMIAALFEMVDASVEEAARSLGATERQTFTGIVLPMIAPGLAGVWVFMFVRTMVAYVAALVLGGGSTGIVVLPLEIFTGMQAVGLSSTLGRVCALAVVLVAATLVGRLLYLNIMRRFMRSGAPMEMI